MNKNIYRIILIGSFIGINVLILLSISSVLSYFKTGADRTAMLHLDLENKDVYLPKVKWRSVDNPGRPMEVKTQYEIQQDYLDAWYVRNVAYKTNDSFGLQDFYTDNARKKVLKYINDNATKDITIENTTLSHNPELDFYSADGQLIVFTDYQVEQFRRIYKGKEVAFETLDTANYKVLMLLEDGFWRIRHMIKEPVIKISDTIFANKFASIQENKIFINNEPFQIKGINYYPQETPWDMFGDQFDIDRIASDFDIIKEAKLNTIRIFVQYEDFGKAEVIPEKLEKLRLVLDTAQTKNLKVVVTLFDFYGDYSILDWTLTHRHVEKIVTTFKEHPSILAWDVKNEPDLDFEARGKESVIAWLRMIIVQLKKYDSNHLVTIGWSNTKAAELLQDKIDLVSFHYYLELDQFDTAYTILSKKTEKPLILQEFGVSSNFGILNPFGTSEKTQANYYRTMQTKMSIHELNYMSWTLYDFNNIPTSVVGSLPWRKNKQKHFGFIDQKGNKKPAFKFITKQ